jgi:hypothetical protein
MSREEAYLDAAVDFVENPKNMKMSAKDFILEFYKATLLKNVVYSAAEIITWNGNKLIFYCHRTVKIYIVLAGDKKSIIRRFSKETLNPSKATYDWITYDLKQIAPCLNQN